MNQHLKQRLVGATVLVVLGIIILPMVLDNPVPLTSEPEVTNIELRPYKERQADLPVQKGLSTKSIPPEVIARYEDSEKTEKQQKPELAVVPNEVRDTAEIKPESKDKEPEKAEGDPQWAVQVGSYSSKENANRLVLKLKSQKLPAFFERIENSNGKTIYRVRVGPFNSKHKTEKMKLKLDQEEKLKTLIVTLH